MTSRSSMFRVKQDPKIDELLDEIRTLSTKVAALKGEKDSYSSIKTLQQEATTLRESIEKLKIEKDRKDEEHARSKRDVEHSTGLLRKQVEWERTKAVDEAKISVREENLSADRTRFEEQMSFHKDQIAGEVTRFENLLLSLMERLPTVSVEKSVDLAGRAQAPAR